ncbi:MAG: thiamine phosphate synthase [Muribaculaceae bacterium]|nr:thiamine phosphate synthase [Muribaculaceae bacterium]
MLQYITDSNSKRSVEDQIKEVLAAGGNWITIDPAGMTDDQIKALVDKIMPLCLEKEAFLLIKDNVALAKEMNIGGVVLSKGSGEFPSHARMTLGAAAVIGVEVYTVDDIAALKGLDVDYVVMTPYKGTADALDIDGIKNLCSYMEEKELELPRVAAGGVAYDDIAPLMEAGCNGVAMSEAIADASDIAGETKKAISLLKKYEKEEEAAIND